MADEFLVVEGLTDLDRAFRKANAALGRDLRKTERAAVEPTREKAETLAVQNIRRIGVPWSRMRIGTTTKVVYLAPKQRGVKSRTNIAGRRPNLKTLLLDRAMVPAFEAEKQHINDSFVELLAEVGQTWESA